MMPRKKRRIVKTLREVAEHLGFTYRSLVNRAKELPRVKGGGFDLDECEKWYKATDSYNRSRAAAKRKAALKEETKNGKTAGEAIIQQLDAISVRKREAEARLKEAQADEKLRQNRIADGEMVPRDEVYRFFSEFFAALRDHTIGIPEDLKQSYPVALRTQLSEELLQRLELMLKTMARFEIKLEEIK